MKLSSKQADELGNALIDASQKIKEKGTPQEVLQLDTGEMFSSDSVNLKGLDSAYTRVCEVYD
jgi:hypothetical protein